MMRVYYILIIIYLSLNTLVSTAQKNEVGISVLVKNINNEKPLEYANVILKDELKVYGDITNDRGEAKINKIMVGKYLLKVSYVGYNNFQKDIIISRDSVIIISLSPLQNELSEVFVTASESRSLSTSSKIGKEAMKHLQPSTFRDILELLPGGRSFDPILNRPNQVFLREVGSSNDNYGTSSLGTSFMMDNMRINTDANMQMLNGAWEIGKQYRNFLNKGVDMRNISTDDIENVEIIRGIPSVEYGDLTSGLIKIERKRKQVGLSSRFKADMSSKLLHISQGLNDDKNHFYVIASVDYLSAKADPRNNLENYKRITASLRTTKTWKYANSNISLKTNLDYSGSIDNDKQDEDIHYGNIDSYKSYYNRFSFSNSISYKNSLSKILSNLDLDISLSIQRDKIEVVKLIQLSRDYPAPSSYREGEHYGRYLPYKYVANHLVDGRPLYFYLNLRGISNFRLWQINNKIKWGVNYSYDKNFGKGQVFDFNYPLYPGVIIPERAFKDIPASSDIALFIQDEASVNIGSNRLSIMGGIRGMILLGLGNKHSIRNTIFLDPRFNLRWEFPAIHLGEDKLRTYLTFGFGVHTKMPTIIQLFPDDKYYNLVQMNYYNINPKYRQIHIKFHKENPINYDLKPAINNKKEISLNVDYGQYRFTFTAFKEDMKSGFRKAGKTIILPYRKFITKGLDHANIKEAPMVENLPFERDTTMTFINKTTNGSRTLKEGLEIMAHTPRFSSIATRFTLSGAYFRTTYQNSEPIYQKPSVILAGREIPYVGIYENSEGNTYEVCRTNLIADTYLKSMGMNISLSFQATWFSSSERLPSSEYPIRYVGFDNIEKPYTDDLKKDVELQWLQREVSNALYKKNKIPFLMDINLKATKKFFDDKIEAALFVNRIMSIRPDYKSGDAIIRRTTYPYFGMELNFRI